MTLKVTFAVCSLLTHIPPEMPYVLHTFIHQVGGVMDWKAHVACDFNCLVENEGHLKVKGSLLDDCVLVKVVGSANGLQGSVVSASDVADELELVSQPYDGATTRIIRNMDRFRRRCSSYQVNMYASLYA